MNLTVIGLGIIGGSYAKGLSKKGYTVFGVDTNLETIEYAKENGIISEGSNKPEDFLPISDLVVIGLYPNDVIPFIKKYANVFKKDSVVTDVCGIKASICCEATNLLSDVNFIGSHPMAGREKVGIKFADEKIFKGTNFLMCPVEGTTQKGIDVVSQMAMDLEFGKIHQITPEFHDEMIAYTSQLTHAIAVSLVNSNANNEVAKFIGDSYRDLTRIAMINENLWSELFIDNKESLTNQIDNFINELEMLKTAIEGEKIDVLKERFISSKKKREVM